MRSDLVYLKDVLGVEFIHTPKAYKKPSSSSYPKITLVAFTGDDIDNEFTLKFEKLKSLLESYSVLEGFWVNPDMSKLTQSKELILCLGVPPNFQNKMSGTWFKAQSSKVMWTHPVNKFEDSKLKSLAWNDIKKTIRTCGVDV